MLHNISNNVSALKSMKFSSRRSTLDESAPQGETTILMQNQFWKTFSSHVNLRQLTILSDKSNAAVDDDGDAVFGQLLVAERPAIRAGGQRDCRVPQCKVYPVEAVDVNCSIKEDKQTKQLMKHTLVYSPSTMWLAHILGAKVVSCTWKKRC